MGIFLYINNLKMFLSNIFFKSRLCVKKEAKSLLKIFQKQINIGIFVVASCFSAKDFRCLPLFQHLWWVYERQIPQPQAICCFKVDSSSEWMTSVETWTWPSTTEGKQNGTNNTSLASREEKLCFVFFKNSVGICLANVDHIPSQKNVCLQKKTTVEIL